LKKNSTKSRPTATSFYGKSKIKDKERFITHTNLFTIITRQTSKHFLKAQRQLHDLLADNDKFLKFLLGDGDAKKIKSFMEHLRTYSNRAGIDEKKMLLRIADLFPDAQKNIEKTTVKKKTAAESIDMQITSPASYESYRKKLKEVIEELPENKKQIQRAREFGDFSENSELDAANERRDYLLARQTELTEALEKVEAVDFSELKIDKTVTLGASVTLTIESETVTYHLLGCWDSNPEMKILSSGSDLTKLLVGKKVGAKVKLPNGKKAEVAKITKLDTKIAELVNTIN
jgi:transcription elongation GreA/GreB family factor